MSNRSPFCTLSLKIQTCCLALLAFGCNGGASTAPNEPSPSDPPTITAVTPAGALGIEADTVTFSATATNRPTHWLWTFGGASAGAATSTEATPTITLGLKSTWNCRVVARNEAGPSAPFEFMVEIAQAPPATISAVTPIGEGPTSGLVVTFEPTVDVEGLKWSWDFGGGAIPNTSTLQAPRVTLVGYGDDSVSRHGSVTATRPGTSAPPTRFEFDYAVWPAQVVEDRTDFGDVYGQDAAVFDGRAVVVFVPDGGSHLQMAIAADTHPTGLADWAIRDLGAFSFPVAVAVNGDQVIIAHEPTGVGTVRVAFADAATVASPENWRVHDLPVLGTGRFVELDVDYVAGRPLVVASLGSNAALRVWSASSGTLRSPGDWSRYELLSQSPRRYSCRVAGGDSQAAILAWESSFQPVVTIPKVLVSASGTLLARASDWRESDLTETGTGHEDNAGDLDWLGPTLGVVYVTENGLELAVAQTAVPGGPADWTRSLIAPREREGTYSDLLAPSDVLDLLATPAGWAVAYVKPTRDSGLSGSSSLRVARALVPRPGSPSDWRTVEVAYAGYSFGGHSGGGG